MNTKEYFERIEREVRKAYKIAEEARAKGLDPSEKVEIPLAMSMAEKVVGLIATIYPQMTDSGISDRILELEKEHGKLDTAVAFKISEEVAKQKFCKFESTLQAMDAGIRIGFAYITLGVVSSPIEGYTKLAERQTEDGKNYLVAYFSGPIRSAGTTAGCVALMLIDYLREMFGYAKYDPTEEEIKRYVTENTDYHERVTNLQYFPTEEEMIFLAKNLPIQIDGEPTERMEVSNYKNLQRVETNYIRGGMCLIFSEGLAQKAKKGFRLLQSVKSKGFQSNGFDFLEEYIELHEQRDKGKKDDSPTYINDLVAGRPVFSHPSRSGGFRFRYGRGRVSGFSAVSMHPATMGITDDFIAIGTQLKLEKPTKGCVVTVCDFIEGPIVKLTNGSVRKIKTREEARKLYPDVEEIIYLGDILFPFSDVVNRNHSLIKPGYVEEWWKLELEEKNKTLADTISTYGVSLEKSVEISRKHKISFYPKYIFYWTQISKNQLRGLIEWLKHARITEKIILPYSMEVEDKYAEGKRALELLGVEHEMVVENIVINEETSKALLLNFGVDVSVLKSENEFVLKEIFSETKNRFEEFDFSEEKGKDILRFVNETSEFEIRDKAGDFIGARMGRPEKAKLRKLTGSPNVLFPVGNEGGRLRSVNAACEIGKVSSSFPDFFCRECNNETIFSICEICDRKTERRFYCPECKQKTFERCKEHKKNYSYSNRAIDISKYYENILSKLGFGKQEAPVLIKGVRGTSSAEHDIEHLAKGVLRAMHNLQVNKDGTIRVDATELPLISFKPKEIGVSVEKLRELGYEEDVFGEKLVDGEQILELKPHDIVLPCPSETHDEPSDEIFKRVGNFVDDLLTRFYQMNRFYNLKNRDDLIGQLGVCMAPHNCAGVICRFIGFSKTQGLLASPYMHAAIRRDCDGDEAAIMLLLDVLLNFSLSFLPSHRGGTQDAPLVLNAKIDAGEVDDQIMDLELSFGYPLELYLKAEERKHSSEIKIPTVKSALKKGKDPFIGLGFTHDTKDFNAGVVCSSYKSLVTMQEKLDHQMILVEKIRAADTEDTARLVIDRHFLKDMRGNLRGFSQQTFRCVECNGIVRRPPLSGVCPACRGKLIFTINEGGIKKYLEPAMSLVEKYHLSPYMKQNIEMTKRFIESIFGKELEKQEALARWF